MYSGWNYEILGLFLSRFLKFREIQTVAKRATKKIPKNSWTAAVEKPASSPAANGPQKN